MKGQEKKEIVSFLRNIEDASLPEAKAIIAQKMGSYYSQGVFQGEEIKLAYGILSALAQDAHVMVRKSLATSLKLNPNAPHDIVVRLANDVVEVAEIILEFSKALTPEDLIAVIAETQEILKFSAIARRDQLPVEVIQALWKKRHDKVIIHLMQNQTACINQNQYIEIINTYQNKDECNILELMTKRGNLPQAIIDRLYTLTSERIKLKLQENYLNSAQTAKSQDSSQPENSTDQSYRKQIPLLSAKGLLTHSLLLRSLCEGNLSFFEHSLAFMLKQKEVVSIIPMLELEKDNELREMCKSAKFSSQLTDAIMISIKYYHRHLGTNAQGLNMFPQKFQEFLEKNHIRGSDIIITYLKLIKKTEKRLDDTIREHLEKK